MVIEYVTASVAVSDVVTFTGSERLMVKSLSGVVAGIEV